VLKLVGSTAGLLLAAAAVPAWDHAAPVGWSYDAWCCGGQDCHPIPREEVRVTPEGYLVTIPQDGDARDLSRLFRYDEVRESGDGQYHACIIPGSRQFRCFYVPPMGF
jgi:hypothetical protein